MNMALSVLSLAHEPCVWEEVEGDSGREGGREKGTKLGC